MTKIILRRDCLHKTTLFKTDIHPLLQRLYSQRGITSETELDYSTQHLTNYALLSGIQDAVTLLFHALQQDDNIIIVGDFDADGATSTALIIRVLRSIGTKNLDYIIPDRFEDGYGLSLSVVDKAIKKQAKLIITVDNGISAIEAVNYAKQKKIKVIITDHHLAPQNLPLADAIINPNTQHCRFPSKNLAGVGVTFYFMLALRAKLRAENWFINQQVKEPNLAKLLDLVALGTIADVVKLDINNRILVDQGIRRIRSGASCAGIKALLNIASIQPENLTSQDLAFYIAPRINAAGRMDHMSLGVELLLCDDDTQARNLAQTLNQLNSDRKSIEHIMHQEAINFMDKVEHEQVVSPHTIVVFDPKWHQGIIGILSSRLKDKYYRPVISFALSDDGVLKGSGRSIDGIHLRDTLDIIANSHPDLLISFGGHAMAVGLMIQQHHLADFTRAFESAVSAQIGDAEFKQIIETDGEIESEYLTYDVAKQLKESGPWGQGFPEPLFDGEFFLHQQKIIADKHLKLFLEQQDSSLLIEGSLFNFDQQQWPDPSIKKVRIVYQLDCDNFRGNQSIKLLVRHIWPIE